MTAKKKAAKRKHVAVWFPDGSQARIDRLVELIEKDMPIKMRVQIGDAVMAAIEEAIQRREDKQR
jgi:hypothetical protein